MASTPSTPFPTPLRDADAERDPDERAHDDLTRTDVAEQGDADTESTVVVASVIRRLGSWAVEHEPESDSYLLIDAAGGFCADLHWNDHGECWAQFEPYVAFSGTTTIADIDVIAKLAELLRSLPPPAGRAPKNPRG
jgi:hypothetical protein